jgi:hypothetical protein
MPPRNYGISVGYDFQRRLSWRVSHVQDPDDFRARKTRSDAKDREEHETVADRRR